MIPQYPRRSKALARCSMWGCRKKHQAGRRGRKANPPPLGSVEDRIWCSAACTGWGVEFALGVVCPLEALGCVCPEPCPPSGELYWVCPVMKLWNSRRPSGSVSWIHPCGSGAGCGTGAGAVTLSAAEGAAEAPDCWLWKLAMRERACSWAAREPWSGAGDAEAVPAGRF